MKITDKHDKLYKKACKRESAFRQGIDDYADVEIPERVTAWENTVKTGDKNVDEFAYIKSLGTFKRGLSLGSWGGTYELKLMHDGTVEHFTFIDISEDALEALKRNAEAMGLTDRIETRVQDFNFIELPENSYDLISCQSMLHHIINLEECLHQINRALSDTGIFVTNECISENKMYWTDARVGFVEAMQWVLKGRWIHTKPYLRTNPKVLTNNCPFECIRSQELNGIIQYYFGDHAIRNVQYWALWCGWYGYADSVSDEYFDILEKFDTFVTENDYVLPSRLFGIYRKSGKQLLSSAPWSKKEIKDNIGVSAINEQTLMQRCITLQKRFPKLYNIMKNIYFKLR